MKEDYPIFIFNIVLRTQHDQNSKIIFQIEQSSYTMICLIYNENCLVKR